MANAFRSKFALRRPRGNDGALRFVFGSHTGTSYISTKLIEKNICKKESISKNGQLIYINRRSFLARKRILLSTPVNESSIVRLFHLLDKPRRTWTWCLVKFTFFFFPERSAWRENGPDICICYKYVSRKYSRSSLTNFFFFFFLFTFNLVSLSFSTREI